MAIDAREFLRGVAAAAATVARETPSLFRLAQSEGDFRSWGRGAAARGARVEEEREREEKRERDSNEDED
jgi:hypothetical protein